MGDVLTVPLEGSQDRESMLRVVSAEKHVNFCYCAQNPLVDRQFCSWMVGKEADPVCSPWPRLFWGSKRIFIIFDSQSKPSLSSPWGEWATVLLRFQVLVLSLRHQMTFNLLNQITLLLSSLSSPRGCGNCSNVCPSPLVNCSTRLKLSAVHHRGSGYRWLERRHQVICEQMTRVCL